MKILLWTAAVLLFFVLLRLLTDISNLLHNKKAEEYCQTKGHIVNDQNGVTGKSFRYGLYRASWNGCEVIAFHNACLLLGKRSSLTEAACAFQKAGAMLGLGFFGSSPRAIKRVCRKKGLVYRPVKDPAAMRDEGVYIFSFWTGKRFLSSLHTVAVYKTSNDRIAYNLHGNGRLTHNFDPCRYEKSFITAGKVERKKRR